MIELKCTHPKARKEHTCMYCGGKIEKGEIYERQTNVFDNQIYDWVCHTDCQEIAQELDMFDYCDDGLNSDDFCENINDYIGDNYRIDDEVPSYIVNMSKLKQVRMILSDIKLRESKICSTIKSPNNS